jgi:hypothetical protein
MGLVGSGVFFDNFAPQSDLLGLVLFDGRPGQKKEGTGIVIEVVDLLLGRSEKTFSRSEKTFGRICRYPILVLQN